MKRHILPLLVLGAAALQTPIIAQDLQEPPSVTFQVEVNYVDVDAVDLRQVSV